MAAPTTPCEPWTSLDEIVQVCRGLCNPIDQDLVDRAVAWSSAVLYRLDGRRLRGLCTVTVSACWDDTACGLCGTSFTGWSVSSPIGPVAWSGWYNVWRTNGPGPRSGCGCQTRCNRHLLLAPVGLLAGVLSVTFDGVAQPADGFRIVDRVYVERIGAPWPTGTDIGLTLRTGRPIPDDGRSAASELACHWLMAHGGADGTCALPENLTSITREEVTLQLTSQADVERIADGLTGLPWVDRWLRSRKVPPRARVFSSVSDTAPSRWHVTR